jgi:2-phospho-L-lactate guanylyltransferase
VPAVERTVPFEPCVIVPVQALDAAKSRLAEVLAPAARADLVRAMLGDVLAAVRAAHAGALLLVTPDARYADLAAEAGAVVLGDAGTGYNAAVRLALASPEASAAGAAAILPADQARAQPAELGAALAALADHEVVLVPSLDRGTGLLALRPPDAIEPAYGPGSAASHERAARQAGRALALLRLPSLQRDVDTVADLLEAGPPLGARTSAFVAARRELLAERAGPVR